MSAEVKPGYKLTEVGVIPEDWEVFLLSETAKRITDGEHLTPIRLSSGYYLLSARNILNGRIDLSDVDYVGKDEYRRIRQRCNPETGDVLISCSGTIGRVATVPNGLECVLVRSAALIKPNPEIINGTFVQYFLQSTAGQKQIFVRINQGAQANLFLNHIQELRVPLPQKVSEQEAIAEALSDADALIESLEQLITKKCQIKQGAMQELLTGKKRMPGFSGEWDVKKLGDLFRFSGGYSASRDQLSSEGHCYLHYGDIHGSSKMIIDAKDDYQNIPKLNIPLKRIASNSLLEDGDVVFVDASEDDEGTSKYIVVVNKDDIPFIAGLHTIVAKSKTDELTHEYRRYCFQTKDIHQQFLFFAVGTKVSSISKSNIPKLTLPVPSYPEQAAIAEILMDMDSEIDVLEVKLEKARQLKQGMMHNLLTGKIRLL